MHTHVYIHIGMRNLPQDFLPVTTGETNIFVGSLFIHHLPLLLEGEHPPAKKNCILYTASNIPERYLGDVIGQAIATIFLPLDFFERKRRTSQGNCP